MSNLPVGTVVFENVSKRYRLGALGTLRSTVAALSSRRREEDAARDLWALKDVSFRVEPGQSLGLIGPNGAGKTTTLKLLSNITRPSSGRIEVGGRMSSLIELGAGFHPELSGRDNIFLNGAILGLSRREIQRKLDEIVAFSELERFIDTPVKRYSSGMYVRLGFAVAAHVEPEILIVDEVLAVGDASFREKCVNRIEYLKQMGTTLLFVSHNMYLVLKLCQRALFLSRGELIFEGPTQDAIEMYERRIRDETIIDYDTQASDSTLLLKNIRLTNNKGASATEFVHGDSVTMICDYSSAMPLASVVVRVRLLRKDGFVVSMMATHHQDNKSLIALVDSGQICMTIPKLEILSGYYFFEIRVMDSSDAHVLVASRSDDFYVMSPGFGYETDRGIYRPQVQWEISK